MPIFIPVNPPPLEPEPLSLEATGPDGSLELRLKERRIEEQVRLIVQDYKTGLQLWSNGLIADAISAFDRLSGNSFITNVQPPDIESECNAYSKECGGVSMDRLRSLVFTSSAILRITDDPFLAEALGSPQIDASTLSNNDATKNDILCTALDQLLKATEFERGDASQHLMIGQCAMLLGQLDIAISAFGKGLGSDILQSAVGTHEHTVTSRVLRPRQWWCAQEMVRAALMRGDADLALNIVERIQAC
ncbi:hypothetical protein GGI05_001219, partial [Coemansia sp. RSA 2603]